MAQTSSQAEALRGLVGASTRRLTQADRLRELSDPTWAQVGQQAASSAVQGFVDVAMKGLALGGRIQAAIPPMMGGVDIGEAEQVAEIIPSVRGQEDRFYSKVAGGIGSSLAFAPAAMAGPAGVGLMGASVGAESGLQAAEAAGASPGDTALVALGEAFLGATEAFGAGKALTRFGLKPGTAGRDIMEAILVEGPQELGQQTGSDALAKATYDPQRVINIGRALEGALAASVGAGGIAAGVGQANILRAMALREKPPAATPIEPPSDAPAMPVPEPAPAADLTGADPRSLAEQLAQGPAEPQLAPTSGASPTQAAEPLLSPLPASAPEVATYPGETAAGGVVPDVLIDTGTRQTYPPTASPPSPGEETALPSPDDAASPEGGGGALPTATGIKHAELDRKASTELPKREAVRDADLLTRAKARVSEDPHAGQKLVEDLEIKPRPLNDEDGTLLGLEIRRLVNERDATQKAYIAEPTPENLAKTEAAQAAYDKAATIARTQGSERGAALRNQRLMFEADYSLAAMTRKLEVAKGGEKLTAEESKRVEELHAKIAQLESDVSAIEAKQAEIEFERQINQAMKPARKATRAVRVNQINREIETLVGEIGRSFVARAGVDPVLALKTAKVAKLYIEKGILNFATFAEEMVARAGESIRPYLQGAWDEAKREASVADVAKSIVESGAYTDRAKVVDAVHAFVGGDREAVLREIQAPQLKAYKTRLGSETEKLRKRTAEADFEKRRPEELRLDEEALSKKTEREKVRREFEVELRKFERARRSRLRKIADAALNVLNLPRALWSSFDVSGVLRQGGILSSRDVFLSPKRLAQRIWRMLRALSNEDYATKVDVEIREHPLYADAKKAGLELTGVEDPLTLREEAFISEWSDAIPGVKHSARAYRTYLNLLRFDHFRRLVAGYGQNVEPKEMRAAAHLVNVATGRGSVGKGKFAKVVDAAGSVLWAPRLYVSRFQFVLGTPLFVGTRRTRLAAAREYATSLGALYALNSLVRMGLSSLGDDDADEPEFSFDTTSPDGLKIRMGDTRVDMMAGLAQTTRLLSRIGVSVGESLQGEKPEEDVVDLTTRFLRTKVSPTVSVPYQLVTGKNVAFGREVDRAQTAKEVLVPLSFRDIAEAMEDQGIERGVAIGLLALFGASVSTYDDKKKEKRAVRSPMAGGQ